jgi:hypothetical protein
VGIFTNLVKSLPTSKSLHFFFLKKMDIFKILTPLRYIVIENPNEWVQLKNLKDEYIKLRILKFKKVITNVMRV